VTARKTIDDLLAEARAGVQRVTPEEAATATKSGAVLVDVRSADERERQGCLPGAVHHSLSVVLWRLDPDQPTRNPKLPLDTRVLLICRQGYSSSLAAAHLRQIGFQNATDVIGGVDAWIRAGLPVQVAPRTPD
jgi:rhodanese-related sulfurtransferase